MYQLCEYPRRLWHCSIDIHYNEEGDSYRLIKNPLSPIPNDEKSEKRAEPFMIDNYPELTWLKGFRVEGYPDVIRVPFRMPPFSLEYVPARIERYGHGTFHCTVLCQPKMECNINKGDCIEVRHFMFDLCIIFDVLLLKKETGLSGGDKCE
jgi:hypothetical protein